MIAKKEYDNAKVDIWSCRVILYIFLDGFLPFQEYNIVAMYQRIYRSDFKCQPWLSSAARKLITKMLDMNPNSRITITMIMSLSWFKKFIPRSLIYVLRIPATAFATAVVSIHWSGCDGGR